MYDSIGNQSRYSYMSDELLSNLSDLRIAETKIQHSNKINTPTSESICYEAIWKLVSKIEKCFEYKMCVPFIRL